MKVKYLLLFLLAVIIISCNKAEEVEGPSASVSLIKDCNDPADGSPSLDDMSTIGLVDLTSSQSEYEVAIANASPQPTTLAELQAIINTINSNSSNQEMPFGVNLAGAEFAEENMPGILDEQYTYPNAEELDYYKSKGLTLIRLPFRWERIQLSFGESLETENINKIKEVVKMATDREMQVILDLHNYGRYRLNGSDEIIGSDQVSIANVKDLWTKLAAEFKGETNIWGYGIMNEPHDMLSNTSWFSIAQEIINGIRSIDTKTTIIVSGDSWSSAERWKEESDNLKNLVDPSNKIIYEAHVYFDANAGGFYGDSYDDESASPQTGVNRVQPFIDWLKENNLRGYIGEYGIPDDDARWLTTLDNFLTHIKNNCINGTYWAGGPWWGTDKMAIDPTDDTGESNPLSGAERPQMSIVEKYTSANTECD